MPPVGKKATKLKALMDGVDMMSRGELVIQCEKKSLDGGKTVASMKYQLKRYYEEHGDSDDDDGDAPPKKKKKLDDGSSSATLTASSTSVKPGVCPKGGSCPELHSLSHRLALSHDGYRPNPIKCRDGMGCAQLKDKEHLIKYAHDDDLSRVCPDGTDCPRLHILAHRKGWEHPGFRAQPFACRDGKSCAMLKDRGHLYKYAHEVEASDDDNDEESGTDSPAKASPTKTKTTSTLSSKASSKKASTVAGGGDEEEDDETPAPCKSATAKAKKATTAANGSGGAKRKTLADVPLESAPESTLEPVEKDSEAFWDIEEKFAANLQGANEDYVGKRIKAGKKPLRFILTGAEKVINPVLEERYNLKKAELMATEGRDSKDYRDRVSFHGTHPKNLKSILHYSLLRFKHPLNPCKVQVDDGYFGTNKGGVYVSRYADYTLKYSNRVCSVDEGDEVKTIMFKTLPGKTKHITKLCGPIDPTPGYDSHSSPSHLEWYLFDEAQLMPQFVLKVKAVADTRTAADDE